MPRMTKDQKKKEFRRNFDTMNDSARAREVYSSAFADQSEIENLLASGGAEKLGTLNTELASLSAMNTIRESERKQAFDQDMLFDQDVALDMRDASYIEATAEIQRRKAIKSHRWDKTRKRRMMTSRETLTAANDKIRNLKRRLQPAQGEAQMTVLQRVEAMKSIYDQIRIADRNFAEATALSKAEESKLKDKAELTYCKSMKKLLEREMKNVPPNSREYAKLRSIYDLNERSYNKLMQPIWDQNAANEVEEGMRDLNRADKAEVAEQRPVLMDEKAEELVSANVSVFGKFCVTLNDRRYGNVLDELWNDMKNKANALIQGWDQKSDLQRGDALADVLISANRLLTREGIL